MLIQNVKECHDANFAEHHLQPLCCVMIILAVIVAVVPASPAPLAMVQGLNNRFTERIETPIRMPAASRND
jgi:hypothetical protein